MQETKIDFYSHHLGRSLEVVISGHWGFPILMFPTSMGNVYQNRDFGLLHTIENEINSGKYKVFNVETIDFQSFYGKELAPSVKIYNYNQYSKFLKNELLPFIQRTCNVHRIGVAGCSFGAYHAANFAFKNPDSIDFVLAMSGAYSIKSFMNGYYDDNVYFNNPVDYLQNAESWQFNHMNIVLGTSDWDICRKDTIELSSILANKGINHWYDERKWANHDWPLWNSMFPDYLSKVK